MQRSTEEQRGFRTSSHVVVEVVTVVTVVVVVPRRGSVTVVVVTVVARGAEGMQTDGRHSSSLREDFSILISSRVRQRAIT